MSERPWHERAFRRLLRLFPAEFRGDFGDQMAKDFQDQHKAARADGRPAAVRRLWRRTVVDLLTRAPSEHLDEVRRDAGHAWRLLRRQPSVAIGAVLTLAFGIGLNTAVFSFVRGVLLRDLPIADSSRLVRLYDVSPAPKRELEPTSSANLIDWRASTKTLDGLAIVSGPSATLLGGAWPERIVGMAVSDDFFRIVPSGVRLGRVFNDEDYASQRAFIAARTRVMANARPTVVILSDGVWQRQFGGARDVIGRHVTLDGRVLEVVGVLAPHFPLKDFYSGDSVDYWVPEAPDPAQRRARYFTAIGRLKAGTPLSQAQAEFDLIGTRLAQAHPDANAGRGIRLQPLLKAMTAEVATRLWLLFGAALCVLVIGIANVAGLLLAQASGRRLELATRIALGASRGRLMRQIVTEGLVLGALGGAIGVMVAAWAVPAIAAAAPAGMARIDEVRVSGSLFMFGGLLAVISGGLCGLAACWQVRRLHAQPSLRSTGVDAGAHGRRVRQGLTIVQIALALMLTIGAGLLVRTLRLLDAQPLGYDPSRTIAVDLPLERSIERSAMEENARFQTDLAERIRRTPGVVAAGIGPRVGFGTSDVYRTLTAAEDQRVGVQVISAGFAEALGAIPVRGRLFSPADVTGPPVLLINETAARLFFNGADAIGQTLVHEHPNQQLSVVGVIKDIRVQFEEEPPPTVYALIGQNRTFSMFTLLVRGSDDDPRALLPAIRTIVAGANPNIPLTRIATLEERLDGLLGTRRFTRTVVGSFSVLALVLAMVGVYGLLAESVASRVPEIGIRMALGATAPRVIWMVLSEGGVLILAGIAAGLGGAALLHRTMGSFVFGVTTTDPLTYIAVSLALAVAAVIASLVPARRAASVDPVVALRYE